MRSSTILLYNIDGAPSYLVVDSPEDAAAALLEHYEAGLRLSRAGIAPSAPISFDAADVVSWLSSFADGPALLCLRADGAYRPMAREEVHQLVIRLLLQRYGR
jgi:hypothetical protein